MPGAYRVIDYSADLVTLLRAVVGGPAVLVGHSLGAVVAMAVAAEAPDLVRALVLEEPPLSIFGDQPMRETRAYEPYRRMRDLALGRPSLAEAVAGLGELMPGTDAVELRSRAAALVQRDPEVLTFVLEDRAKEGLDLDQALTGIACPVLLLQGNSAQGAVLGDEQAAWAAARLRDCTRVSLPNAGHFIHRSLPLDVARLVAGFLETL